MESTPRKRVLVLSDDLSEEGGIRTRVLGEVSAVMDRSSICVVARARATHLQLIGEVGKRMESELPDIKFRFVPMLPHRGYRVVREVFSLANILMIVYAGLLSCFPRRPTSIYAHNLECSLAALVLGGIVRIPVTSDLHGDEAEENIKVNGWKRDGLRHRYWRSLLELVVLKSDVVACVSMAHKSFIESVYGRRDSVVVIPCCVNRVNPADDAKARPTLSPIGPRKRGACLLFYAGSASEWQLVDKMAEFFSSVSRSGMDCSMLLLMSDRSSLDRARRIFSTFPGDAVRIESVERSMVNLSASASDVGLLLREDLTLNNISSPTKFAEYMIAGLPVVISPRVGDYSSIVESRHLGKVVDLTRISDPEYTSSLVKEIVSDDSIRERCRNYASESLTWDSYKAALLQAFFPPGNGL